MGEPGMPELVKLEDLEAGSALTGRKHILSLLVENRPGVLARIAASSAAVGSTSTRSRWGRPRIRTSRG